MILSKKVFTVVILLLLGITHSLFANDTLCSNQLLQDENGVVYLRLIIKGVDEGRILIDEIGKIIESDYPQNPFDADKVLERPYFLAVQELITSIDWESVREGHSSRPICL